MLTQKPKQLLLKRQQWQPLEWLDYVVSFRCNNRALAVCWVPGCSRSTLPIPYSLVTLVAAVAHCKHSWWMDLVHKELMHGGENGNSDMIPKQKRLSKLRSEVQVDQS